MKDEVFNLKGVWYVAFNGKVVNATWFERGPAEALLSLLKCGYSVITETGGVKHVGGSRGGDVTCGTHEPQSVPADRHMLQQL